MLFTPGNRPDMVAKAVTSGTDAVIVDLEDAVPADAKATARAGLADLPSSDVPVYVRVNAADTEHMWADVVAAVRAGVAGVVLPKADDPDLLARLCGALTALELATGHEPGRTELVPLVESARGVQVVSGLVSVDARVDCVLFGSGEAGDLVADLGCEWTPEGTALLYARSQVLLAARAAGLSQPMDAVFMNFRDDAALRTECELARRVGYVGKVAIHPRQIPVIHDVFTPSAEETSYHRRVLDEFERALAEGSASISVDGRMVDYAVARTARQVLARARAAERAGP